MERRAESKGDEPDEKSCKGEKDAPDEKDCSPRALVANFLEYAADNRDMREAIERFMERNCDGFASAEEALETGAGHPLEWTRIHEDYLALVEQQLERFCAREGVTSQEVFAATRNAVEDGDLSATQIMPGFLHSLEYVRFVSVMTACAKMPQARADAARFASSGPDGGGSRLNGHWRTLPARAVGLDEFIASRNLNPILQRAMTRLFKQQAQELVLACFAGTDGTLTHIQLATNIAQPVVQRVDLSDAREIHFQAVAASSPPMRIGGCLERNDEVLRIQTMGNAGRFTLVKEQIFALDDDDTDAATYTQRVLLNGREQGSFMMPLERIHL